jgi:hypothetical protein
MFSLLVRLKPHHCIAKVKGIIQLPTTSKSLSTIWLAWDECVAKGFLDRTDAGPSSTGTAVHVPDCLAAPWHGTTKRTPRRGPFSARLRIRMSQ